MRDKYQQIVEKSYEGGEFKGCQDYHNAGDTLFTFLMIELSEQEGCDSFDEALRRCNSAIEQIEEVRSALAKGGDV